MLLFSIKHLTKIVLRVAIVFVAITLVYLLTLSFPQPFFKNKVTVGNITVYSDEELPKEQITLLINTAVAQISKSVIYKPNTKQRIYIANNPIRWIYFTNFYHNVGGINYVPLNHSIFLRKADVIGNRLYGPSGNKVPGDRTLDYFMAHEMTHTLEYQSMPWYKYPIKTNWILEGYAEYIAHDSADYTSALSYYLNVPESSGAKYYTKVRALVAYMLEIRNDDIETIWSKSKEYESLIKTAIPNDNPKIDNSVKIF